MIALDISLNRKAVASPTCFIVTFLCIGALSSTTSKIEPKSFIPLADKVFIGPADIPFILQLSLPKSTDRYFILASNAAFATPITLYPWIAFSDP